MNFALDINASVRDSATSRQSAHLSTQCRMAPNARVNGPSLEVQAACRRLRSNRRLVKGREKEVADGLLSQARFGIAHRHAFP